MEHPAGKDAESTRRSAGRVRWGRWLFPCIIAALVAWGIWSSLESVQAELVAKQLDPRQFRWMWFLLASACYVTAQIPTSTYWREVLSALGQPSTRTGAFRAFFIGHLGKYVPSKLLVVAIRAGLIAGPRANVTLCATSVFVETLTTMAVGAGLATSLVIWLTDDRRVWAVAAVGLVLCYLGSLPSTLRLLASILLRRRWTDAMDAAFRRLGPGLLLRGWGYGVLAWVLLGCSLYATLHVLPAEPAVAWSPSLWLRCLAAVCLAVVAGFISQLPAGLLAREWVLGLLLLPVVGTTLAVAAPVLLRVNWLLTELAGSAILLCVRTGSSDP